MIETIIGVAAFIIGLTFYVSFRRPYYEIRGALIIEWRPFGIGFSYTWSGPGFCNTYQPSWNIYRGTVRR